MKIIYFLFLFPCVLFGQQIDKAQFGFTIRATFEIPAYSDKILQKSENEPKFNFRISASAGVANRWVSDNLYPSVNLELQLYKGGIGGAKRYYNLEKKDSITEKFSKKINTAFENSNPKKVDFPLQLDAILAFTLTAGFVNDHPDHNSLLRYFSDFATPSLRNPYSSSLSLGTNMVITTDSRRKFQRLGFFNLNVKGVQLSYYNDGGFGFRNINLGDKEDRFYTGGGSLSYDFTDKNNWITIEVSAHKFTGNTKSAFEFSNETESKTVRYKDPSQYPYNKSVLRANFIYQNHHDFGFGFSFSAFNKFDIQHFIHRLTSDSYHIVLEKPYYYLEPYFLYHTKN